MVLSKTTALSCLAVACLSASSPSTRADAFGLGLRPSSALATTTSPSLSSLSPGNGFTSTVSVGGSGGSGGGVRRISMYSAFKKSPKGGKKKGKAGGGKKGSGGGRGGGGGGGRGGRGDGGPPQQSVDTSRKDFVYQMNRLSKSYGKGTSIRPVLKDVSLSFYPGAKIGVLGSNGSGKSTLMKIMAGVDQEFQGESRLSDWAKVGYLEQEPKLDDGPTVSSNIEAAVVPTRTLLKEYEQVSADLSSEGADMDKLSKEMDRLQNAIEAANGWELDRVLDRAMDALRCPDGEALVANLSGKMYSKEMEPTQTTANATDNDVYDDDLYGKSGGERRRVALCKLLLRRPDLLLLDEPTNHLDAESVAWMEDFLKSFGGTVVAITHDRYFLDNVAEYILELDRGEGFPFKGNYSGFLEKKMARLEMDAKIDNKRKTSLKKELEWVRMNPKARQAKSKARLARYDSLSQADEAADAAASASLESIFIPPGNPLGTTVVEAKDLGKAKGDRLLYDGVNFSLPRGGVVGIIGANGAGKSTLLNMIAGLDTPDMGSLTVGETVDVMYVDQNREGLDDPELSVFDAVTDGADEINLGPRTINSRAYLSWFNFKGGDQQKKVNLLSGGERNRLNLARTLKQGGNLLMLDEPTNDLDVDTLRALEDAIDAYPGCAVIVSHDRYFLDKVATHTLAFEDDGGVVWFEGSFAEYEQDLRRRAGGNEPKRPKFRPLPTV